jgi:hypothetical protein
LAEAQSPETFRVNILIDTVSNYIRYVRGVFLHEHPIDTSLASSLVQDYTSAMEHAKKYIPHVKPSLLDRYMSRLEEAKRVFEAQHRRYKLYRMK